MTGSGTFQRTLTRWSTFVFFIAIAVLPALAQSGSLHGTVADTTGAVIPAATITVTGADGSIHTAIATGTGAYGVDPLAPAAILCRPRPQALPRSTRLRCRSSVIGSRPGTSPSSCPWMWSR